VASSLPSLEFALLTFIVEECEQNHEIITESFALSWHSGSTISDKISRQHTMSTNKCETEGQ
jgi:hypothetical protein